MPEAGADHLNCRALRSQACIGRKQHWAGPWGLRTGLGGWNEGGLGPGLALRAGAVHHLGLMCMALPLCVLQGQDVVFSMEQTRMR